MLNSVHVFQHALGRPRRRTTGSATDVRLALTRRKPWAVLTLLTLLLAAVMVPTTAAHAAPGDPFDAATPLVFVAQGSPTQLYRAVTNSTGTVVFTPEGPPAGITYNAISYNQADNYLYGVVVTSTNAAYPVGSLVRVGQGGVTTRVGTATTATQNVGGFGSDGLLYTTSSTTSTAIVRDPATGAVARTITLSQPTNVSDWTYAQGFLWGISDGAGSGPLIVRTDPTTGVVTKFPAPAGVTAESAFGAAWTFGNGNLGFSANDTGTVYQFALANPAGTPTFTLIAVSDGPSSFANDGAASAGLPTDLSIVKTGPAGFSPDGGTITYNLTVTNNGPGVSSGFVMNDTVPSPLTNVASPDAACSVLGNIVRCVGGVTPVGASVTYTVTATVPAGTTTVVQNTASVTPNEQDPVPGNNSSTSTAGPTGISLVKHAATPVDANSDGLVDAGDTIQYTFDVTNTGAVELAGISVADAKIGTVICPQPTLAGAATQTCTAESPYVITQADVDAGIVANTATASGTTPDGQGLTSEPSSTSTPLQAAPALSILKSASPSDPSSFVVGQTVTYSFLVTNTGNV
ncbi:DUF11 domain-containing protein, partial [Microbacterium sp. p3-SID336]|uniref:DUF11 domain-containing protein n=1 Tax=Microbacterium sp. p3-SID336 TaxID=2916212 RepID=UPI0021A43A68